MKRRATVSGLARLYQRGKCNDFLIPQALHLSSLSSILRAPMKIYYDEYKVVIDGSELNA